MSFKESFSGIYTRDPTCMATNRYVVEKAGLDLEPSEVMLHMQF